VVTKNHVCRNLGHNFVSAIREPELLNLVDDGHSITDLIANRFTVTAKVCTGCGRVVGEFWKEGDL